MSSGIPKTEEDELKFLMEELDTWVNETKLERDTFSLEELTEYGMDTRTIKVVDPPTWEELWKHPFGEYSYEDALKSQINLAKLMLDTYTRDIKKGHDTVEKHREKLKSNLSWRKWLKSHKEKQDDEIKKAQKGKAPQGQLSAPKAKTEEAPPSLNLQERVQGGDDMKILCEKMGGQLSLCNPNSNLIAQVREMESYKPQVFAQSAKLCAGGSATVWFNNLKEVQKKLQMDRKQLDDVKTTACKAYGLEVQKVNSLKKNSYKYHCENARVKGMWTWMVSTFKTKYQQINEHSTQVAETLKTIEPLMKKEQLIESAKHLGPVVEKEFGYAKQYKIGFTTYVK